MRANEGMDKRVAQYLRLDSWLFWTIVRRHAVDVRRFASFSPPQRTIVVVVVVVINVILDGQLASTYQGIALEDATMGQNLVIARH